MFGRRHKFPSCIPHVPHYPPHNIHIHRFGNEAEKKPGKIHPCSPPPFSPAKNKDKVQSGNVLFEFADTMGLRIGLGVV